MSGLLDFGTISGAIELDNRLESTFETAMHQVTSFSKKFVDELGWIGVGAGLTATAILGIAGTIVTLGTKGSEINDIEGGFDRLAKSSENADKILASMRKGVAGAVTDLELMTRANTLLAAGVEGNADDFEQLTRASKVLSNEGYGPLSSIMSQVDRAMQTGSAYRLNRIGLEIDMKKAEENYARTLGLTSSELTEQQSLHAKRAAIIAAATKVVHDAGEQELSFGDKIGQIFTGLANWSEELQSRIAKSVSVNRAFEAIHNSIVAAFGGDSQALLEWTIKWVDRFSQAAQEYVPPIVRFLGNVKDGIVFIWDTVVKAWDSVPDWLKNIAENAAIAYVGISVLQGGVNKITSAFTGAKVESTDWLSTFSNLGTISDAVQTLIKGPLSDLMDWGRNFKVMWANRELIGGGLSVIVDSVPGLTKAREALNNTALATTFLGEEMAITGMSTLAAGGAIALVVAGAAALGTIGYQAYKLWAEGKEHAAEATKNEVQANINLQQINTALHTSYTTLDEAMEAVRAKNELLQKSATKTTEVDERAVALHKLHGEQLDKLVATLVSTSNQYDVAFEALSRMTVAQWNNIDVQKALLPLIDAEIEKGHLLTAADKERVGTATLMRLAREADMKSRMAEAGLTAEEINRLKELGWTTAEIGRQYNATAAQVELYASKQMEAHSMARDAVEAELSSTLALHNDNVNDWMALENKKYENTVAKIREAGKNVAAALDAELKKHNETVDAEMRKRAQQSQYSQQHFQTEYDDAKNALDAMLADRNQHTEAEIRMGYEATKEKEWNLNHWAQIARDQIDELDKKNTEAAKTAGGIGTATDKNTAAVDAFGQRGQAAMNIVSQAADSTSKRISAIGTSLGQANESLQSFLRGGSIEQVSSDLWSQLNESERKQVLAAKGQYSGGGMWNDVIAELGGVNKAARDKLAAELIAARKKREAQEAAAREAYKKRFGGIDDDTDDFSVVTSSSTTRTGGTPGGGIPTTPRSPVVLRTPPPPAGGVTFATGSIVIQSPILTDPRHIETMGRTVGTMVMDRLALHGRRVYG